MDQYAHHIVFEYPRLRLITRGMIREITSAMDANRAMIQNEASRLKLSAM
jgi:hypothetical protein